MDIKGLLMGELSRHHTDEIANMAAVKPELFQVLWDLSTSNELPINWRAAWVIETIWQKNPDVVSPYIDEMCGHLPKLNVDGTKRLFLKMIAERGVPEDEELTGILLKTCFDWLASPVEAIAVKAHAMQILYDIGKRVPEIFPELKITIEVAMAEGSVGIVSRGGRILQEIGKLEKI